MERDQKAFQLGVDASIYGCPLVLMDVRRRVMTGTWTSPPVTRMPD